MDVRGILLELALEREGATFAGLARASGMSARDCALAARTGRLGDVVRAAEKRRVGRADMANRTLPGHLALARVRAREVEVR